jgi:hypothetical protein
MPKSAAPRRTVVKTSPRVVYRRAVTFFGHFKIFETDISGEPMPKFFFEI